MVVKTDLLRLRKLHLTWYEKLCVPVLSVFYYFISGGRASEGLNCYCTIASDIVQRLPFAGEKDG
jgi:hypothetical protein